VYPRDPVCERLARFSGESVVRPGGCFNQRQVSHVAGAAASQRPSTALSKLVIRRLKAAAPVIHDYLDPGQKIAASYLSKHQPPLGQIRAL
jgi:hypothetical protein